MIGSTCWSHLTHQDDIIHAVDRRSKSLRDTLSFSSDRRLSISKIISPRTTDRDDSITSEDEEDISEYSVSTASDTPARSIRLGDAQLSYLARKTEQKIDWEALSRVPNGPCEDGWRLKKKLTDFSIFTRTFTENGEVDLSGYTTEKADKVFAVFGRRTIKNCTAQEIRSFLQIPVNNHKHHHRPYNSMMSTLHGKEFVYGTAVHHSHANNDTSNTGSAELKESFVNTAIFSNSYPFARNEQWCFLDFISQGSTEDSESGIYVSNDFRKICAPLSCEDLYISQTSASKTRKETFSQLQNLITGYWIHEFTVEDDLHPSGHRISVDIMYYAQAPLARTNNWTPLRTNRTSNFTLQRRLLSLAKSMEILPRVIMRRRLGMQRLVDHEAIKIQNQRCVCCIQKFRWKQKCLCDICGFYVCVSSCCQEQEREQHVIRGDGQNERLRIEIERVRVCERCLDKLALGDYDDVCSDLLRPPRIQPDAPDTAQKLTKKLRSFLRLRMHDGSGKCEISRLLDHIGQVFHHVQSDSTEAAKTKPEKINSLGKEEFGTSNHQGLDSSNLLIETICLQPVALRDCVVGESKKRAYPLTYANPEAHTPDAPRLPPCKLLAGNIGYMPELSTICDIAAKLLNCSYSVMTLQDGDFLQVVGVNAPEVFPISTRVSTDRSLCAHMLYEAVPAIYQNLPSDLRFHSSDICSDHRLSFYIGFPIHVAIGTQVIKGSLCCMNAERRQISQSEYTLMVRLALTASNLIEKMEMDGTPKVVI
uniref:Uncharacterized protein AlNc14C164G7842 n=1 Tax=Albugo laibachii Nc14 TaxID=890382 RepID=F0WN08_9STRA|nr:conserved hypothetical protein [Albugo laibachii Nc14]|eukprot:CCA22695.1 conserved hypothetical protein [Albugo laibachii Nc14]